MPNDLTPVAGLSPLSKVHRSRRDVSKRNSRERTLNPPAALKLLGRPPLINGEKLQDFHEFRLELARDLNPGSFSEWLIVDDIAKLRWVTLRLRKAEAGLFDRSLSHCKQIPDAQISLGVALENSIDIIERIGGLIDKNERRCDVLHRTLERLQAYRHNNRPQHHTIDLEADEIESEH